MRFLPLGFASVVVAVAVMVPVAAAATQDFPDVSAVSPSGRYRIDATSPENARTVRFPNSTNFTYTLTDTTTKKVVWERKQPMNRRKGSIYAFAAEGSPIEVFVDDTGLVVSRTGSDSLVVLDPADGHCRGEAAVLGAFPKEQVTAFVGHSLDGPEWAGDADLYFLNVPSAPDEPARTLFVVRPYWNHRIIIDTKDAKHIDLGGAAAADEAIASAWVNPATQRILAHAIEDETHRAVATVERGMASLPEDSDRHMASSMRRAVRTIGFLKVKRAEPALRAIEKTLLNARELDWLRGSVREALRGIGATPAEGFGARMYVCVQLGCIIDCDEDPTLRVSVPVEQRADNAERIKVGMSFKEVTDLLGYPDAELNNWSSFFDYDIDAGSGYTLRVSMGGNTNTVQTIRRIEPFAFLHDPHRISHR